MFVSAALFALAATLAFWLMFGQKHTVFLGTNGRVNYTAEEKYWEGHVPKVGQQVAHEELARAVANLDQANQHLAAHAFGAALWNTTGIHGAGTCDQRFSSGCTHSYIAAAIAQLGLTDGIRFVGRFCMEKAEGVRPETSCQHGIGHGLVGYLGYELPNLTEALSICDGLPHKASLTMGCWGGVLMEYNFRGHIQDVRPLTTASRFEPCFSLPEQQQSSCLFWQPLWWYVETYPESSAMETFAQMGSYCTSPLLKKGLSGACLAGIGFMAPGRVEMNPKLTAQACVEATHTGADRISCWSGAAVQLAIDARDRARAFVCEGLADGDLQYCQEHINDIANLFSEHGQSMFP